ncbi:monocarboxylate transporter 12-like [Mercenaria mercenaria]|uniref:monocarboxylate transporter 12-like n=1 Tax=Mercenaria mercenaria TaxID=6596 RepID=UPI00234EBCF8|nr:monocarboxylate transporter 12-like [Mercenaria mercenaria]
MVLLEILIYLLGISTGLSFLLTSFETKLLYMSMYGIFTGGYNSLCPVVLADLFGTETLDKSFGLMMLIIGIADAVSTPSLGWLFDITGNYNMSFIVTGAVFTFGGVLMLMPRILLFKKRLTICMHEDIPMA